MSTREFIKTNIDFLSEEVLKEIAEIIKVQQPIKKQQRKLGGL